MTRICKIPYTTFFYCSVVEQGNVGQMCHSPGYVPHGDSPKIVTQHFEAVYFQATHIQTGR